MKTERIIRAAFSNVRNAYETHRPVLCEAVLRVPDGSILELGAGEGSTLPLHEVALATGRSVITLESDRGWHERFEHLRSDRHTIVHVPSWTEIDLTRQETDNQELHYAIAFVDHAPVERRIVDIKWLAQRAKIIVAHDTNSKDYYDQICGLFRYRTTYKRHVPWTSVFSNFVDVSEWIFDETRGSVQPLKFIGDLSAQDSKIIETYARRASRVLEFGVGGSTQIIAQSISESTQFLSLDTDPAWIETTEHNLQRLGVQSRCSMMRYEEWAPAPGEHFDLIFNDGTPEQRLEFALRCFSHLRIGGFLLFHDTRGLHHIKNVTSVIEAFYESIGRVTFNEVVDGVASNITVVEKKVKEPYVNWNEVEGRPPWAFGHGTVPDDFWR